MNEQEKEIDLKRLFYRALKKWRTMVVAGAIGAVVVGGTKCAIEFAAINNPETLETREMVYQAAVAEHETEGEVIRRTIENTEDTIERQTEYNEKSVLMAIDPYNEWCGSLNVYVGTDYQILPDSTFQNENPAASITRVYGSFLGNGELYEYVKERLDYEIETRFLTEALAVSADAGSYIISVSVRHESEARCNELLDLVWQALQEKQKEVTETMREEHTLSITNRSVYAQVNLELEQAQKSNLKTLVDLDNTLFTAKGELFEWQKETVEQPALSARDCIVEGIKWAIIAGAVIVLLIFAFGACGYLLGSSVQGTESFPRDVYIIGALPEAVKKKKFAGVDRWICRRCGVLLQDGEYEARLAAISEVLGQLVRQNAESTGRVALVSDIADGKLATLADGIKKSVAGAYTPVAAGNALKDVNAAKAVAEADAVVLVAEQGGSATATLEQMAMQAVACGKTVLGGILLNADARP